MSVTRRIFSLLLVLSMIFALVACGGGESSDTQTEEKTETSSVQSNVDNSDFSESESDKTEEQPSTDPTEPVGSESEKTDPGAEEPDVEDPPASDFEPPEPNYAEFAGKGYTIIQHQAIEDPFGYSQDTRNAQLVLDRIGEVQAKYGCELFFSQIAYSDNFATEILGLSFAEDGGDMVFSHNNAQLRKALGTGGSDSSMMNLLLVDDIINFWDLNKWGNITSRETMMAGGTFYGVTPALWYNYTPLPYYNLVYNRDLLAKFNLSDPQEYWEQNAWDRDVMLDLITSCYDDSGVAPIWGLTASRMHMVRASYLSSGVTSVVINKIHANGAVDWTHGMSTDDAVEALQWLKNSVSANQKYFNNGQADWANWSSHTPFLDGQCLMALTAPSVVLDPIAVKVDAFGLIPWGGADTNVMTGYYENCCSVAIPTFAKDGKQSAYLMHDLFKGLGDAETKSDVVEYYRSTYFESDLDVKFLLMDGAKLNYSYWPNGGDEALKAVASGLMTASSVRTLVDKSTPLDLQAIESHIVPNTVQLEIFRQNGVIQ